LEEYELLIDEMKNECRTYITIVELMKLMDSIKSETFIEDLTDRFLKEKE
jgi:hypothetical protein